MFRSAQHDNYLNPIHGGAASNVQNQIMNEQQTLDKAGTPRRLKIMNNEAQSIYGLLVNSEEKGRRMETAVYATCILSVVVAICQFIAQPTPTPFGDGVSPARLVPVMSQHAVKAVVDTKS